MNTLSYDGLISSEGGIFEPVLWSNFPLEFWLSFGNRIRHKRNIIGVKVPSNYKTFWKGLLYNQFQALYLVRLKMILWKIR